MKKSLTKLLFWARDEIYRGRLEAVLVRLSLKSPIRRLWRSVIMTMVGEEFTAHIDGTGANFQISSFREYSRLSNMIGEEKVIRSLLADLQEDDVVYDVGANIGIYSCFIMSAGVSTQTISFEPHTGNIQKLSKNLNMNGDSWRSYQIALGDKDAMVPFHIASDEPGESRHSISTGESRVKTMQQRGDTLVKEETLPAPTIMKIDVEGAEYSVIRGFGELLQNVRIIYCEIHKDADGGSKVERMLRAEGFDLEVLQSEQDTYHVRASR